MPPDWVKSVEFSTLTNYGMRYDISIIKFNLRLKFIELENSFESMDVLKSLLSLFGIYDGKNRQENTSFAFYG